MLEDVGKTTPQYMEGMEQVFEQCQQFEEKRLVFLKEVLLDIKRHLNLAENSRYLGVVGTVGTGTASRGCNWHAGQPRLYIIVTGRGGKREETPTIVTAWV